MADIEKKIYEALAYVEDPDLKKDLVTLGMIQKLQIEGKKVSFDLVLTTPACPMKDMLHNACVNAIKTMVDKEMEVLINVTSNVSSSRQDSPVLQGVRNIVAVASGKGGVGKSTIAMELAKGLKRTGATVGILDADIHGPSIPLLLGAEGMQPEMRDSRMFPIDKDGIKLMSIGFLVPKEQAVVWRGPMLASALKQFAQDVEWGSLDYLVIDLPPGTGDVHLSLIQQIPVTGVVIVTTPDELSVADARKAINMYQNPQLKQEILGVVENMSYFRPVEQGEKYFLFGKEGGKALAQECNLELLCEVPMAEKDQKDRLTAAFDVMTQEVARQLAILNAKQKNA